jgi:hypothetical protein
MKVAVYKNRRYRLLWAGNTKYGERAHLQFFDGSKDFWVDRDKIEVYEAARYRSYGAYRHYRDYCPCSGEAYCRCGSDAPCCMCD